MIVDTRTDPPTAAELRTQFVDQLVAAGAVQSPRCRDAFTAVPRHLFVPEFSVRLPGGRYEQVTDTDPDRWLTAVYSDQSLITQRDSAGIATSSSTQPSAMARMVEALDLDDGLSVLEVGTGSGYNAAILCHILGDTMVTSVDIDPGLVEAARRRLVQLGYRPTLSVVDGRTGYSRYAPYDRIIGTCGVTRIPTTWLDQIQHGGVIVTGFGYGTVRLQVDHQHMATGRFVDDTAFMVARAVDDKAVDAELVDKAIGGSGQTRATALLTDVIDAAFGHIRVITCPGVELRWHPGQWYVAVDQHSGSWARAEHQQSGGTVVQSGPRRLWDEIEAAYSWWVTAGRPGHGRLGLTVSWDSAHKLWVDGPGQRQLHLN